MSKVLNYVMVEPAGKIIGTLSPDDFSAIKKAAYRKKIFYLRQFFVLLKHFIGFLAGAITFIPILMFWVLLFSHTDLIIPINYEAVFQRENILSAFAVYLMIRATLLVIRPIDFKTEFEKYIGQVVAEKFNRPYSFLYRIIEMKEPSSVAQGGLL